MPGGARARGTVAEPRAPSAGADPAPRDAARRAWGSWEGPSCVDHRLAGLEALRDARLALDLAPDVLHRLHRAHARHHVEVVLRRRRGHEPLERVGLPRVRPGDRAVL